MAEVPDFPLPVRAVYTPDGSLRSAFLSEVDRIGADAKQRFEAKFGEIGQMLNRVVSGFGNGQFSMRFDLPGLRQAAADAEHNVQKLIAMRDAAKRVADQTKDTSSAAFKYAQALQAQVSDAERAKRSADDQVRTYTVLQREIDVTIRKNDALRQSYRALYAEEAAATNFAHRSQQAVNAGYAPGLGRIPKSARSSADVFENYGYRPTVDLRSGVESLLAGKASMDAAALSGVTLDNVLGRVATKGPLVAAAMREAAEATERATRADQQAAASKATLAASLDRIEAELDPLVAIQQRFAMQMATVNRAFEEGVIDGNQYAAMQQRLQAHLQRSVGAYAENAGALRQASVQAGQQLQDIAISLYSGQRASVVFAQQLPQLAFALTSLEGSANKTHDRIGKFATFLAGPWGLAVGLAVGVAGTLIARMFDLGEETDETSKKSRDFVDIMRDSTSSWREVTEAARDYAAQQEKARQVTLLSIKAEADATAERIRAAISIREKLQAELEAASGPQALTPGAADAGAIAQSAIIRNIEQRRNENQKALDALRSSSEEVVIKAADAIADIQSDPAKRIKAGFDALRQSARETIKDVGLLTQRIAELNKAQKSAEDALRESRRSGAGTAARDARVGDMTALIQQLFPGARITSTTGGKHTKGSDHYAGRAIDFVPAGGMGQYTTAEVEQILEDAGVDIRRNARGTKQIFGPGRSASRAGDHNDHFHVAWEGSVDPERVANATARAQQILQQFGERSAESIARINERFDEQPRLIDQAAQATRQLDAVIADLSERKPPGYEQLIAAANAAKQNVGTVVARDIAQSSREMDRQYNIQLLLLQGRDREAAVMEAIVDAQRRYGENLGEHEAEVRRLAELEYDRAEAMRRALDIQRAYLDATRSVRSEVEAILSGQGKIGNFKQIFRNLQGRIMADQLFGDIFDDLDDWVKEKTGIGSSVDALGKQVDRSTTELGRFVDSLVNATGRINGAAGTSTDPVKAVSGAVTRGAIATAAGAVFRSATAANDNGGLDANGDIVVVAPRKTGQTVNDLSPEEYFDRLTRDLGKGLADSLNGVFDTTFFTRFSGVLGGALGGYATGGAPGGIIGAIKGIEGLPDGIVSALGKAGKGASTGTAVAGIADAFGINLSNSGAQIGGAIGSFVPIPGGDIIGAIAGGIIGKLIGGTKRGSVTIGGVDGGLGITGSRGNSGSYIKAATGAGDSIIASVSRIADAFGATVNAALGSVSIGIRDGKYRVDPTGSGITKTSRGAVDFGKDGAEEAARYATLLLIQQGVIENLRQGVQTILKTAKDLDTGLQDALDFQSIFDRLKAYKDPVGAALDTVDREFARLRQLAETAGEGMAEVEELYWIERAKAVDEARKRITGSLQSLLDDLTIGDSGLSLRARRDAAQAAYDPLKARVLAGDVTAYDDFASAAQSLLGISRELYGSQSGYFSVFDEVKSITQNALDATTAIAEASANRDSPFSGSAVPAADNASVVSAIENQTSQMLAVANAQLAMATATNQNISRLLLPSTNDNSLLQSVGNGGDY